VLRSAVSRTHSKEGEPQAAAPSAFLALGGLLFVAFLLRIVLIGADGFRNDVSSFEGWTLTLVEHPLRDFYKAAGFADYPPGYFFVLWIVGHIYKLLVHSDPGFGALKIAVKLPAILMDLVDSLLIFAIVRRFSSLAWAFAAAALCALNPATIFISAYWGQVDSVAAGVVLGALLLVVWSDGAKGRASIVALAGACLLLAYSILIKPPASVLIPLFLLHAFTGPDRETLRRRLTGTALGAAAGFALAYLSAIAFQPAFDPQTAFGWLIQRYQYGSGVYAYNSVNAFNLYTIRSNFWESDSGLWPVVTFGLPQWAWGIALVVAASALVLVAYAQKKTPQAFLEAACLLSLAFFVLSTRMHERYVFNGLILAIPLIALGRRYRYASAVLSFTLFVNLLYSLQYLKVMDQHIAGIDAANMWPLVTRACSILNVAVFFYLGFVYTGAGPDVLERFDPRAWFRDISAVRARPWWPPLEGTARMGARDWSIAGALGALSFAISYAFVQWPAEKVFDEIYYARAAEEYLQGKDVFEWTHPPLTKLFITVTTALLGDQAYGWRMASVIVGALTVVLLYAFAKRLLGSTLFASIAAGMLVLDGFHLAQSRIATPEITVAFFALLVLYAFYRFWLASQVRIVTLLDSRGVGLEIGAFLGATAVAAGLAFGVVGGMAGTDATTNAVAFVYFELGGYVLVRLLVPRLRGTNVTTYPDGSIVRDGALEAPGGAVAPQTRLPLGAATLIYNADLSLTYETPEGTVRYGPDGTMTGEGVRVGAGDATFWFWFLALAGGALAASKWNGLFDFFVVWLVVALVVAQRYVPRLAAALDWPLKAATARWGNPRGFSLDLAVTGLLFVAATIYLLSYVPFFSIGKTLGDAVRLQSQMYGYHHNLVATHPYSSQWWQWPILQIPISYYYTDFRVGADKTRETACCVAEILALPNPLTWLAGLITVPLTAWFGWRERRKGYLLLVAAYFIQWLPWIGSPRIAFEYHFYPNLAIILLCDAIVLQRIWEAWPRLGRVSWARIAVGGYLAAVFTAFWFWYPVTAGTHISWQAWNVRMLTPLTGSNWINPHPGQ
jgi:hypothetical protein